jgi:hypothetical protein
VTTEQWQSPAYLSSLDEKKEMLFQEIQSHKFNANTQVKRARVKGEGNKLSEFCQDKMGTV